MLVPRVVTAAVSTCFHCGQHGRHLVPADVAATYTSDVTRGEPSRLRLPAVTRGAAACRNERDQRLAALRRESRAALPAVLSGMTSTHLRRRRKSRVCNVLIWKRLQRHFRRRIFDVYARSHFAGSASAFPLTCDRDHLSARSRSPDRAIPACWQRWIDPVTAATRRGAAPRRCALSSVPRIWSRWRTMLSTRACLDLSACPV
jgi:hypothetical protein